VSSTARNGLLAALVVAGVAAVAWAVVSKPGVQPPAPAEADARDSVAHRTATARTPAAGDRAPVETPAEPASVRTPRGGLVVHVFDEERDPVPGMAVHWTIDSDPVLRCGVTDPQGALIHELEPGNVFVVTVAGQRRVASSVEGPARVEFLVRHFRRIAVVVTDPAGAAVPAAGVQVGSKVDEDQVYVAAVTDGHGCAQVDSFDERDLLSIVKGGFKATQRLPVTAAVPRSSEGGASTWELQFTVEPLRDSDVVSGRVVDELGRPVAAASITWWSGERPSRHRGFLTRAPGPVCAVSEDTGRFRLPLCGQQGRLLARRDGFADRWLALEPATYATNGIEVVMVPEVVVHGIVLDQEGRAVSGAELEAGTAGDTPRRAMTDCSGRFTLRGVRAGPDPSNRAGSLGVRVTAFHPARGAAAKWTAVHTNRADVELTLAGARIVGSVRRGASPVPSTRVAIRGTMNSWRGSGFDDRGYEVLTDSPDGRFVLARPEGGRWSLLVEPPAGSRPAIGPFEVPGSTLPSIVDIDLDEMDRGRGTVELAVVDSTGIPVDSYWLRLFATDEGRAPLSLFCGSRDGRMSARVPIGTYDVAVSPRGGGLLHKIGSVAVAANEPRDLGKVVVQPAGSLHGTLEPPAGGTAQRVVGHIIAEGSPPAVHLWTGVFGPWRLDDIAPGRYVLKAGERSQIDFDPCPVEVMPGSRGSVQLFGRPCRRVHIHVRVATTDSGRWILQFENCRGEVEQRAFDPRTADHGVVRIGDVHLRPGVSKIAVGAADAPLRVRELPGDGSSYLWVDAR
jgi:hypothetical protein